MFITCATELVRMSFTGMGSTGRRRGVGGRVGVMS